MKLLSDDTLSIEARYLVLNLLDYTTSIDEDTQVKRTTGKGKRTCFKTENDNSGTI